MTVGSNYKNVIGRRIFRQSIVIALVMTVFLTSIQVWVDYSRLINLVQSTFQQIKDVQVNGLTTALWNYSLPELDMTTKGLIHYPYIAYVEISDREEIITSAGVKLNSSFIDETIPLIYDNNGVSVKIGTLLIQADRQKLYESILLNIGQTLLWQALYIIALTIIFLVLIERQITRYLRDAVDILQTYDINNLESPLKVKKADKNDEIDKLVVSFNELRQRLYQSNTLKNEMERKHSTLLRNLPGMAYRCKNDENWTMEVVSAGCFDLTGYSPEELINNRATSYESIILAEDRDYVREVVMSGTTERRTYELMYRIVTKSDQVRWVWERGMCVLSTDGEITALEGFITDITDRKQQERDLQAIASVSYGLRSVETRDEILSVVLDQTTSLLNADGCLVELIEPETGDSYVMKASGIFVDLIGKCVPVDSGLNTYIRKTGKPYLSNNVYDDPMILDHYRLKTCKSTSGVPMITQGNLIGFLWIGRNIPISEKVVQTMTSIADIAANAIHRVDLFQQTGRQVKQLIGLRKIDTAINSNLDLDITLEIVLDQAVDLLHVDAARLLNFNTHSKMITFGASKGFSDKGMFAPQLLDETSYMGKTLLQMKTILINDVKNVELLPETRSLIDREGFTSFVYTPLIVQNEVRGILEVFLKEPIKTDTHWIDFLETIAGQAAIAINDSRLWQDLRQSNSELQEAYDKTLEGWSNALDLRDHETEDHTKRVTELSMRLAVELNIRGDELANIRRGAILHDIGKMGVPDNILTKPGKLTEEEWVIMREHPQNAYNLLYPILYLRKALDIPYCHHEKWDGSGYPRGLKGGEIPLAARIFAFADVWDAMTSDRYYRPAMSKDEARDYIEKNIGRHFDPGIAELFLKLVKE